MLGFVWSTVVSTLLTVGILFTAQYMMYTSDYTPVSKLKDLRPLAPHSGGSAHILRPNCSIYVLDVVEELNDMATMPACDPEKYSVWPHRSFPRGLEGRWSTPHHIGQHAAPFYLHQALLQSPYVTDSIDTADIVFVHQHCYTMMWLSGVLRSLKPNPGQAALQQAFYWLRTTDRWKRHNGADYLWFFSNPNLVNVYDTCAKLTTPYFLASERGFRCASSPDVLHQLANRTLLVSYLGNADRSFAEDIYKHRKTLVFFVGGCSKKANRSQGQRMRAHVVQHLRRDPRARVRCKCSSCWGRELHHHVVQDMQHSQYCLVMPGDTQASRRLTEAVLAGCIPVFIGPPFHTFPMAHVVPYTSFAFFFSFDASKLWPDNTGGAEERVWLADIDIADVTIPVQSPADVLQHLEGLGDAEAKRRLSIMSLYRQYFWYQPMLSATGQQMAVDAILERVCEMHAQETKGSPRSGVTPT